MVAYFHSKHMCHGYLNFFIGCHKFLKSISKWQEMMCMLTIELSVYSLGIFSQPLYIPPQIIFTFGSHYNLNNISKRWAINGSVKKNGRKLDACAPPSITHRLSCCLLRGSVNYVTCIFHFLVSQNHTVELWLK